MVDSIAIITSIILCTGLIVCALILWKNDVTYKQHILVLNAIAAYRIEKILAGESSEVEFDDMEDYDKTLLRIWDWGYKRILPKDKFEIIKPYIKKKKKKK